MSDDNQHPPMNGDEELAKTLEGGLQFEETPGPGDGDQAAPTMSAAPSGTMGDPLANMPTPTLPGDEPGQEKPLMPPLDPSALNDDKPADEGQNDLPADSSSELPSVHHAHENQSHMGNQDDKPVEPPKEEKPQEEKPAEEPVAAPYIPALHKEDHDEHKKPSGSLEKIKESALEDLKPLVGKLKLEPDEKFDTLLLIIRSTDDQSLLDEAHAAAKDITDETKRAQALLDIIKEVDYFSNKK